MSVGSVARQYANALFAVAEKTGDWQVVGTQLQNFADLVDGHPDLKNALQSSGVPKTAKRSLVAALVDRTGPMIGELRRLLDLLGENDRLAILPDVAAAYRLRALAAEGVMTAELVTAFPLAEDRRAALARALSQATGKRIDVTGRVDPSMIGGVIARVGSVVYDGSVTRQLERLRNRLSAEV